MTQKMPDLASLRSQFWPHTLANGVVIRAVEPEQMKRVIRKYHADVFPNYDDTTPFSPTPERSAQLQQMHLLYGHGHTESFLFYGVDGQPFGWSMGEAEDAITFYVRNTGIHPDHQNKGVYRGFANHLEKYLVAIGYERITSQHQATNRRILIRK